MTSPSLTASRLSRAFRRGVSPSLRSKKILMRMDQGVPREEAEAVENAIYDLAVSKSNALIDRKGYMEQTGLTAKEMEELERVGLLMPFHTEKGKPLYDHDDVAMGKSVFKNFFRFNVPLEELRFYVDLGQKITEEELNLRKNLLRTCRSLIMRGSPSISPMRQYSAGPIS